jgi:hypothetical protein
MVDLDEFDRQLILELIHDQAGATVAGVDHHLERLESGSFGCSSTDARDTS